MSSNCGRHSFIHIGRRPALAWGAGLAFAALAMSAAQAATMVWGGGNGTFSTGANWIGGGAPDSDDTALFGGWAPLSRTSWTVSASLGSNPSNAKDGDRDTQWTANTDQVSGQYVIVNLGSSQTFRHITMDSTITSTDYPRAFDVYVSTDGSNWGSAVTSGTGSSSLVTVTLPANQTKQYIKIQLTASAGQLVADRRTVGLRGRRDGAVSQRLVGQRVGPAAAVPPQMPSTETQRRSGARASSRWASGSPWTWALPGPSRASTWTPTPNPPTTRAATTSTSPTTVAPGVRPSPARAPPPPTPRSPSRLRPNATSRCSSTRPTASFWWALFEFKVYGTPANCNISSNASVTAMSLENSVTVTKSSGVTLSMSGGYSQSAGTFTAGNAAMTVGGSFSLSGGTFTSTSNTLNVGGAFTHSASGTFTHNSGTVVLSSTSNQTLTSNNTNFYDLAINDGLAGYWKLDEGTSTNAADASGYGRSRDANQTPRPGLPATSPLCVSGTPLRSP